MHEQNRFDRDNYITINFDNIENDNRYNFDKRSLSESSYHDTSYDLKSIMQYSAYAFSSNGQKTILTKDGSYLKPAYDKTYAEIMTASDISALNKLYECSIPVNTPAPPASTVAPPASTVAPPINEGQEFIIYNNLYYSVYVYYRSLSGTGHGEFYEKLRSGYQDTLTVDNLDHFEFWIYARRFGGWIELGEIEHSDASQFKGMTASQLYDYWHANN